MNSQQNALVESLECYMEEVVESFEDFVKKSLLLFSVGVCTVVVMLVYVLKMLTERGGPSIQPSKVSTVWPIENGKLYPILSSREVTVKQIKPKVTCTSANTLVMKSIWPSYEEQVLRNIGFSNCHKCMQIGESFDDLHKSFENLHTEITLSSDRNSQRAIKITPVRRRRDLSLPSRIPDNLRTPPLEGLLNTPKITKPLPFFDSPDESPAETGNENQGDNRDESQLDTCKKSKIDLHQRLESKSAYKNLTAPVIQSLTKAEGPAAKMSWTILTRDAAAFYSHVHRIQRRVSDRGKPTPPVPGHHRQLTNSARRCPSPASQPTPNCAKPLPQRKIPQKFCSFPKHGDYLRAKK